MHHLTRTQVRDLLVAVENPRHRCALLVTYIHGLRISETLALRPCDISQGYLIIPRLKGSLKTEQPLFISKDPIFNEAEQLDDLIFEEQIEPDELLFPYTRDWMHKVIKKAGATAGIPSHLCHCHVLKHSIAMHLVKKIGLEELKQYLGHANLNSTGRYLRVTDAQASKAALTALEEI